MVVKIHQKIACACILGSLWKVRMSNLASAAAGTGCGASKDRSELVFVLLQLFLLLLLLFWLLLMLNSWCVGVLTCDTVELMIILKFYRYFQQKC